MQEGARLTRRLLPAAFLAALMLVGFGVYADLPELLDRIRELHFGTISLALGLATLNYVVRFARWHYYLAYRQLDVPPTVSMGVFLSGLSMSVTPGKLGELLKCFMLRDRLGIPVSSTAPVVVAERYTDILGILALAGIGATRFAGGRPVLTAGGIVVLVLLALLSGSEAIVRRASAVLTRSMFGRAVESDWLAIATGALRSLLRTSPLAIGASLGMLAWFLEGAAFFLVVRGFGEAGLGLLGATFTYATATLAGALSMLPGGVGATEVSMVALLVSLGISRESAAGATLVIRASTLWWGVLIGSAVFATQSAWAKGALREARSGKE